MINQSLRDKLSAIRCFLLDMDGTIYLGDTLLEGSLDFLRAVTASGRDAIFLTNNSSKSAKDYVAKLGRMGIAVSARQVLSSGQATAAYLARTYAGLRIFLLGNPALALEMQEAGLHLVDARPDIVVVGYDTTLTYAKMVAVCDHVRAGLPYIATHPDFNCPVKDGFEPDIGAIMAFIEASTGRTADVVVGKPHGEILRAAQERAQCDLRALAICGDRLYTDIKTGVDHGLLSILTLTGEAQRADLASSTVQPDIVVDRLSDLIPYL